MMAQLQHHVSLSWQRELNEIECIINEELENPIEKMVVKLALEGADIDRLASLADVSPEIIQGVLSKANNCLERRKGRSLNYIRTLCRRLLYC